MSCPKKFYFDYVQIFILTVLYATIPAASLVQIRKNEGHTFQRCYRAKDCAANLQCFGSVMYNKEEVIAPCTWNSRDCRCIPRSPVYCNTSSDYCPRAEGCAVSSKTLRRFCVSCIVILNETSSFTPVDASVCVASPTPFPTPSNILLDNRRLQSDFCSTTDPCDVHLKCIDISTKVKCTIHSSACQCKPERSESNNCTYTSDCTGSNVICLRNTRTGSTFCGSCNRLLNDAFVQKVGKNDGKCTSYQVPPPPVYLTPGDGQILDDCSSDMECRPNLKCRLDNLDAYCRRTAKRPFSFKCLPSKLKSCTSFLDCSRREVCAHVGCLGIKTCVSSTFIQTLPWDGYKLIGKPSPELPQHKKAVGDYCKYNNHCRYPLKCTHLDGLYTPCAGRRACQCTSLTRVPCLSSLDCASTEVCANYFGAKNQAFCISRTGIKTGYLLQRVNASQLVLAPRGRGWTYEGCDDDQHCKKKRVCTHISESPGMPCAGRASCVCKASGPRAVNGFFPCADHSDCGPGERCLQPLDSGSLQGICVSFKVSRRVPFSKLYLSLS